MCGCVCVCKLWCGLCTWVKWNFRHVRYVIQIDPMLHLFTCAHWECMRIWQNEIGNSTETATTLEPCCLYRLIVCQTTVDWVNWIKSGIRSLVSKSIQRNRVKYVELIHIIVRVSRLIYTAYETEHWWGFHATQMISVCCQSTRVG